MDVHEVLGRINELAREEHELFERESHGRVTDADRERLRRLEVTLDQCWDLLRQRRARRGSIRTKHASETRRPSRDTRPDRGAPAESSALRRASKVPNVGLCRIRARLIVG